MKKFFLIALLMMVTMASNARTKEGTLSLQPRTGFIVSTLTNMPKLPLDEEVILDNTYLMGVLFGADLEYQLTDMVSISTGLNYTLQGSKWKDYKVVGIDVKNTKIELGYVNVPLLANVYLYKGLAVKSGVQLGFMTNAKMKSFMSFYDNTGQIDIPLDVDIMDECRKVDVSIPVGVSYEFDNHFVVDARYNFGLTNINKSDALSEEGMKNALFIISFGYKINF